ncbi:MAG: phage major capsid protein, partial [Gammaproteobacteria bacterium]
PYSFMRALSYAAGSEMVDAGLAREYAQEAQRRQPWRTFKGFAVPLNVVMDRKATHSTSDASGQPLTFEDRRLELFAEVPNALRISTAAGRVGVRFLDTIEEKLSYPVQTEMLQLAWHAKDAAAADGGQGQFQLNEIVPKYAGLKFDIERSALQYAIHPDVEDLLLADARQAVASGLDDAIMTGAGTATEPQGLFRHPDIAAAAGVGATPTIDVMRGIAHDVDQYDQGTAMSWLLHPKTEAAMMAKLRFPSAQLPLIQNPGELAFLSYITSHKVPHRAADDADLAIGDFSEVLAVTFGGALDLQVNPWSQAHFERGAVLVVGLIDFNVAVRNASKLRIYTDAAALA